MPTPVTRPLGLIPDRPSTRLDDGFAYRYRLGAYKAVDTVVQPIARICDQRSFPSCAGQAFAGCIDAVTGGNPFASGVSIWREARRRQGEIERIDAGTRLEYAVAGLVSRGWDPWGGPGEDSDIHEAGAQDDLGDELFADDKRLGAGMQRYRIDGFADEILDAVDNALANLTLGVVLGGGTRSAYWNYIGSPDRPDTVLDTDARGGFSDGHAERIFAVQRVNGVRRYALQNSWGRSWGGIHLPDGTWQPGCAWVTERVVVEAWDIHVFEPKR